MPYNPAVHNRRTIRLAGYDYTLAGIYFVTLVCHQRRILFGEILNDQMQLNSVGQIVVSEWLRSEQIRQEIALDEWIVMPNHLHALVAIQCPQPGATGRSPLPANGPASRSLGSLIAGYKSACTVKINDFRNTPGNPVWQRNYYEHIIRNEAELQRARTYILNNPLRWQDDEENR